MGRLLGDPEVWDDSPARPRPAVRGLAGLVSGAVAGLLLAFAVVPRPDPPPPEIRLPPAAEAPRLRVEKQVLDSASLGEGPLLVTRSGRLEEVRADGTDRRVLAQSVRASAVVGPDRAGVLVALDSGVVTRVEANGTSRRVGPANLVADGLVGAGRQLLACPDPAGQAADGGLLMDAVSGRATPVKVDCPVAWAARVGVFAGTGGPWTRVEGFRRAAATPRGGSVLIGRPGKTPRVLRTPSAAAPAGKGAWSTASPSPCDASWSRCRRRPGRLAGAGVGRRRAGWPASPWPAGTGRPGSAGRTGRARPPWPWPPSTAAASWPPPSWRPGRGAGTCWPGRPPTAARGC